SPYREPEGMADGSDAIADWPILNALVNTASGASWVSVHHGGGVGIGRSIHAGQVCVADGTPLGGAKLERVLTNDPGMGGLRHADPRYCADAGASQRARGGGGAPRRPGPRGGGARPPGPAGGGLLRWEYARPPPPRGAKRRKRPPRRRWGAPAGRLCWPGGHPRNPRWASRSQRCACLRASGTTFREGGSEMSFAALWESLLPVGRDGGTGGYPRFSWTPARAECRRRVFPT